MGQGLLVPVQGLGDWQLRECMWRHQAHAVSTAPQGRLHTVKERPAAGTRARVQQQPASGRATEWSTRDTLQVWPVIGAGSRRTPTASAANKPWQQTSNGRATAVIQGGRAWQQVVGHGGWLGGGGAKSCLRALTTTWALQRKTAGLNAKSVSAEKTSTMSCAVSLAMLRKAAMPWSACIHAPSFAALLVTLFAM